MTTEIRLNIGAGESNLPGFISIDIQQGQDATQRLPYEDGTVEEVYASHVLEHIHHSKTYETLSEWTRVLKPGGRLRVAIPDFEAVLSNNRNDPERFNSHYLSAWLHGTYNVDHDRHQAVIFKNDLEGMFRSLGFDDIAPWKGEYGDNAQLNPMTLNVEGYKRKTEIPRKPKVVAVLSTPRFGPVDTFKSIADMCQKLGWEFFQWGGTEWGKGLESVIQQVMASHNPDYVMTIDYDGVFTPEDCQQLLDFMQRRPDIGAVWPVQAHRHQDLPLGLAPKGAALDLFDYSKEFTRMWSGHFGCTLIRRQVFETLPHPWFWSVPDPETGDWKNGSDADLFFWRGMHTFGFTFGQLNTVQIGHMEWCVKWLAPKGVIWQPIQNYRQKGRPTTAVFDGPFWVQRAKDMLGGKPEPKPETPKATDPSEGMYVEPPAVKPFVPTPHKDRPIWPAAGSPELNPSPESEPLSQTARRINAHALNGKA